MSEAKKPPPPLSRAEREAHAAAQAANSDTQTDTPVERRFDSMELLSQGHLDIGGSISAREGAKEEASGIPENAALYKVDGSYELRANSRTGGDGLVGVGIGEAAGNGLVNFARAMQHPKYAGELQHVNKFDFVISQAFAQSKTSAELPPFALADSLEDGDGGVMTRVACANGGRAYVVDADGGVRRTVESNFADQSPSSITYFTFRLRRDESLVLVAFDDNDEVNKLDIGLATLSNSAQATATLVSDRRAERHPTNTHQAVAVVRNGKPPDVMLSDEEVNPTTNGSAAITPVGAILNPPVPASPNGRHDGDGEVRAVQLQPASHEALPATPTERNVPSPQRQLEIWHQIYGDPDGDIEGDPQLAEVFEALRDIEELRVLAAQAELQQAGAGAEILAAVAGLEAWLASADTWDPVAHARARMLHLEFIGRPTGAPELLYSQDEPIQAENLLDYFKQREAYEQTIDEADRTSVFAEVALDALVSSPMGQLEQRLAFISARLRDVAILDNDGQDTADNANQRVWDILDAQYLLADLHYKNLKTPDVVVEDYLDLMYRLYVALADRTRREQLDRSLSSRSDESLTSSQPKPIDDEIRPGISSAPEVLIANTTEIPRLEHTPGDRIDVNDVLNYFEERFRNDSAYLEDEEKFMGDDGRGMPHSFTEAYEARGFPPDNRVKIDTRAFIDHSLKVKVLEGLVEQGRYAMDDVRKQLERHREYAQRHLDRLMRLEDGEDFVDRYVDFAYQRFWQYKQGTVIPKFS